MVDWACKNSLGGEIIIPKIPSYRLVDVARAINPKNKLKISTDFISKSAQSKIEKAGGSVIISKNKINIGKKNV